MRDPSDTGTEAARVSSADRGRRTVKCGDRASSTPQRCECSPMHSPQPSQRQFLGDLSFGGPAGAFGRVIEGPLPSLHPTVPGQQGFRSDNGNDIGKALLDGDAETYQGTAIALRQGHSFAQLATRDSILLPEDVVLLGQILAKQFLDSGDQRSGRTSEVGGHA